MLVVSRAANQLSVHLFQGSQIESFTAPPKVSLLCHAPRNRHALFPISLFHRGEASWAVELYPKRLASGEHGTQAHIGRTGCQAL